MLVTRAISGLAETKGRHFNFHKADEMSVKKKKMILLATAVSVMAKLRCGEVTRSC